MVFRKDENELSDYDAITEQLRGDLSEEPSGGDIDDFFDEDDSDVTTFDKPVGIVPLMDLYGGPSRETLRMVDGRVVTIPAEEETSEEWGERYDQTYGVGSPLVEFERKNIQKERTDAVLGLIYPDLDPIRS